MGNRQSCQGHVACFYCLVIWEMKGKRHKFDEGYRIPVCCYQCNSPTVELCVYFYDHGHGLVDKCRRGPEVYRGEKFS